LRLLIRFVRIAYDAFIRFNADDGWAVASHIALSTLLAMFPFLIVVTALAGFAGSKDLADQAASLLMQAWPPEVAGPISGEIHRVLTTTRTDVLTMGLVVAVYFASSGIESLRIGLNRAYDQKETRPWWLLRLESIGYVLLSAVALLIFTLLVVLAPSLILIGVFSSLKYLDPTSLPMTLTRYGLASTILIVALYAVHVRLPAGRRSLGEMTPGIVATLSLWLVSGAVFGRYLAHFTSTYVSTYAGLASVVAALIYLYLNASIFIYGGELNTAICAERKIRKAIAQSDNP
jgi:membrane protein